MSATLLSDLPQTICDELRGFLQGLERCEPHAGKFNLDELRKKGLPSPSVLVSILGAKQDKTYSGNANTYLFQMAAYVVTKDKMGLHRDVAAANICQAILAHVPGKSWEQDAIGQARDVNLHTLLSGKTRDNGVALWAVTWNQPIGFFSPAQWPLGLELYVSLRDGPYLEIEVD